MATRRPKALSLTEVRKRVSRLRGWTLSRRALRRRFRFETFPEALRFVARVGAMAEKADHHPDIDIRYRVVRLALRTHDVSGISLKDFSLAAAIERDSLARKSV